MAGIGSYDAEGWTDLVRTTGRTVYVSAAGDNSNDGLSHTTPKRTIRNYFQGTVSNAVTSPTTTLIPSANAQQSSGYVGNTLHWTSGTLNGTTATISGYSVVSGEVRLVVGTMSGTPAAGDTFFVVTTGGAFDLIRDGYPDWLCLRSGDTFEESVTSGGVTWEKNGLSAAEPIVMTNYYVDGGSAVHNAGARAIVRNTAMIYNSSSATPLSNLAFSNIEFTCDDEGTTAFQFAGSILNILVEGCLIHNQTVGAQFLSGNLFATLGTAQPTNLYWRRNVLHTAWAMGVYFHHQTNLYLHDNLFDFNGILATGSPKNTEHGVYSTSIKNLESTGNIFSRNANFGIKMSADELCNERGGYADFLVENNLFYNNGISQDWSGRLLPPSLTRTASQDNTSASITPSTVNFVGTVTSGTRASTTTTNGTYHLIEDSGDIIDIVYGWDMWFDSTVSPDQWLDYGRVATGVTIACYLQGLGDEMKVKAWNFTTDSWDTVGTITGGSLTVVVTQTLSLTADHTGPLDDAHEGKVYIRLTTDSTTPSVLAVDQIVLTADEAYTHQDGIIRDNVFTMSGRKFGYNTDEWNGVSGSGQDLQAYVLSSKNVDWDGNLFVHKPNRINQQPLAWASYYLNAITVQNSVVYDWYYPGTPTELTYLNLNSHDDITLTNNQITVPGAGDAYSYLDPTRSVASYYQNVIGATVSDDGGIEDDYGKAFFIAARSQLSKENWNTAYTADAVNTWIKAGFNIGSDPAPTITYYVLSAGGLHYLFQVES